MPTYTVWRWSRGHRNKAEALEITAPTKAEARRDLQGDSRFLGWSFAVVTLGAPMPEPRERTRRDGRD